MSLAGGPTAKAELLTTLAGAGDRVVDLVGSLDPADGSRVVPRIGWTVAETAAHLVTDFGRLLGDRRRSETPEDTGRLNAVCLGELADRDLSTLAARLRADVRLVVDRVYPKVDFDRLYPFHAGTTISGRGGAAFILCELLVHGYDIASTVGREWTIPARDAGLAVRGPAEFWTRLLASENLPRLEVDVGQSSPVEFPIQPGTISGVSVPLAANAVELLLAAFARTTASDERIASVLAALPQL
jgi:uncharacterized protein (TIGR03083 family)